MQNSKLAFVISIFVGVLVWFGIRVFINVSDPQSTTLYWYAGYPFFLLTSFVLGYCYSVKAWKWPLCVILSQLIIGIGVSGGQLNLLPIGIIVHIVISIPCFVVCYLGVFLKGKREKSNFSIR